MKIIANNYEPKDIVRMVREWTSLTQAEFGCTIHRSRRGIQSYENGTRNYTMNILMEIAKEHDIEITLSKKQT